MNTGGERWMSNRAVRVIRLFGFAGMVVVLVGIAAAAMPAVKGWLKPESLEETKTVKREASAELADAPNTIRLPADVAKKLGVAVADVKKPMEGRPLRLEGSLALDPDLVHRARARFAG